ncbi:MAG: dual specificity protein phosphatase [Candidatus Sericytochromatia bacterium]|nr:dual specificity protein phosphatase [Candidatus Sericytochromatia bacterium]
MHFDWISQRVALGPRPSSTHDLQELAFEGITHVVNMAAEVDLANLVPRRGLPEGQPWPVLTAFPVGDAEEGRGRRGDKLRAAVAHVTDVLEQSQEHRVYVHCVHGVSRSATVVLGWLMQTQGMSVGEALVHLRAARPKASPHPLLVAEMLDTPRS